MTVKQQVQCQSTSGNEVRRPAGTTKPANQAVAGTKPGSPITSVDGGEVYRTSMKMRIGTGLARGEMIIGSLGMIGTARRVIGTAMMDGWVMKRGSEVERTMMRR